MSGRIRIGLLAIALAALGKSLLLPTQASSPSKPQEPAAEETRPSRTRKPRHRVAYALAAPAPAAAATAPAQRADEPKAARFPLLTESEFHELTEGALDRLPTAKSLRRLTDEEAHSTPPPVLAAGDELGRIAQTIQEQPELAETAADFYARCARDGELLATVRALCYSHVLDSPQAPPAESLPENVVRLARLIPAG